MNRFRTKKKAKDDASTGRSSEDSEQSSLPFKVFSRGKKTQQEEVKKEFDLSTALPSNDDFRTSLLMSNLSARFSMLREQDDPNTKIGKASDDSVLYPKRQSRLADFGFVGGSNGLTDIAEVESIKTSPFLRTDSFASDEAEKSGSVLTRAKPTEGNNLFGGRQKIYKIPAGSKGSGGGMIGRALYDDDVAMSAFQRWRQEEKARSLEDHNSSTSEDEAEQIRPESPPPVGYNRNRETSSTTSSASIAARNSTAATSITSQAAWTVKDGQSPTSATAPAPERMVTRTRRLYEQCLVQDPQDQQTSALSRIENLTRQRLFNTRAPDLSTGSTSQASASNSRTILTKASAPNLRSASPTTMSASPGALDLGSKVQADTKHSLGGVPPLSPPLSEAGEQTILPILPNDMGKATAMGLFQKPQHSYDESQYVQRQLQLRQGREAPTQRPSTESNAESASQSQNHEAIPATGTRLGIQDDKLPPTPLTDRESPTVSAPNPTALSAPPAVNVERPSDEDHPAFRQSAMPTALPVSATANDGPSTSLRPKPSVDKSQQLSPLDSPTLGPTTGLSGMVRQHLRMESMDSFMDQDSTRPQSNFNPGSGPSVASEQGSNLSPWLPPDQDWTRSYYGNGPQTVLDKPAGGIQHKDESVDGKVPDRSSNTTDEADEFASQLAEARRRVREKLTSYVETDSSRAASPDLSAQVPSNPLGIGMLKPKSSKGSLVDRSRNMPGQSRGLKILGIGAGAMSSPPQSAKQSVDEKEAPILETMREEAAKEDAPISGAGAHSESTALQDKDEDSTTHPGLRAFRQARRELQKRKELESLARHQVSQTSQSAGRFEDANVPPPPPRADRGPRQRTPSRERKPPPITYRQRAPSDERGHSSPAAQRHSDGRDRSGSETSGGRSGSRPPRLRTNTNTGPQEQLAPGNSRPPMMRSPGLPGTDIKGSPIMPPYPYPNRGAPSPAPSPHPEWSRSAGNLAVYTGRPGFDPHSGQPSPISPMGLPSPSPLAMGTTSSPVGTPTSIGPRPRRSSASQSPALGPGVIPQPTRRPVDKRDISEPTLMTSTSRIPTMNLPHQPPHPSQPPPVIPDRGRGLRSRSNSRGQGAAPPVPPINPRRRREDSGTLPLYDEGMMAPRLPFASQANNSTSTLDLEENRSAFSVSDDDNTSKPDQRRRLQKPNPNAQMSGTRFLEKGRDNSPPFIAKGPPASRTVATSGMRSNTGMGVPGGMF
ncbi:PH domain-containing protein [Madurella fahalii]|uniref:PH domain-containing protein n=1 Tax=Madurella fahalii TaxID=1157608 RepID=A0ABQ0GEH3_9PEZI